MKKFLYTGLLFLLTILLCVPVFAEEAETPASPEYEEIVYGLSGAGRELMAYRFGSGENVMVLTFTMHGYEDNFPGDGIALVRTAEALMDHLKDNPMPDAYNWTIYVLPCLNPDGLFDGWTNYGPGRCTTTWIDSSGNLRTGQGIDMNRCFPTYFLENTSSRNRTTSRPMACLEAQALDTFIRSVKGSHDNIVVDVHGWLRQTITKSSRLATVFQSHFPDNKRENYEGGNGYFVSYAYSLGYETCLLELAGSYKNLDEYLASNTVSRFIYAVRDIMKLQPCVCDSTGHNYITEEKAATCAEAGYLRKYCTSCDDTTVTTYMPQGHLEDPNSVALNPAPTATKNGQRTSSCGRCGAQLTKYLSSVFNDTAPNAYYSDPLDYCYAAGYISGTGAGNFSPNMALSRGMLVTMLYRMEGCPEITSPAPFADVTAEKYYCDAVSWAYSNGIASGISATSFAPDNLVTREQAMTFFFRYIQYLGLDNGMRSDQTFLDSAKLHSYAAEAAQWSVANGIICGDDKGNLMPLNNTTRAQSVTILKRVADYVAQFAETPSE